MITLMDVSESFRGRGIPNTEPLPHHLEMDEEIKVKRRRRRRTEAKRIPLWYFLYELLCLDTSNQLLQWSGKHPYEFTIKSPKEVAELWGQMKEKSNMTYAKLARGIRYYYGKGVIEKVPRSRFSYRFILSRKTSYLLGQIGSLKEESPPLGSNSSLSHATSASSHRASDTKLPFDATSIDTCSRDSFFGSDSSAVDYSSPMSPEIQQPKFVNLYHNIQQDNTQEDLEASFMSLSPLNQNIEEASFDFASATFEEDDAKPPSLEDKNGPRTSPWQPMRSQDFEELTRANLFYKGQVQDSVNKITKGILSNTGESASEKGDKKSFKFDSGNILQNWLSSDGAYARSSTSTEAPHYPEVGTSSYEGTGTYRSASFLRRQFRSRTDSTESTSTTSSGNWGTGSNETESRERSKMNRDKIINRLCTRLDDRDLEFDSESDSSPYSP